ncbi:uncharacterized protein SCHCODRAFT_02603309 [Schizophyllum commune H4-8]|uniref:Uncharacterized protein n=1 Tax=Schizophyllum commune (strain H4-8 / FGSC 9210) TaxID=578458 RepID=D8QIP5_SCHCM|nr:uncharacterized protein SCHCODRAFT_02603309 [Schizophyllum commune H4-8]KAI5886089.1 hypothetical protein SCHCODRAFT_02603309 [Schizophyllum commune H4-8]
MKFATLTALLAAPLVSLAAALPVERDVYAPPVTYPSNGTVWKPFEKHNVTWDVSDPPKQITNPVGTIRLVKDDRITPLILADNFDILLGTYEVTVPWVETGDNYRILLFGDSGNWGDEFTIEYDG